MLQEWLNSEWEVFMSKHFKSVSVLGRVAVSVAVFLCIVATLLVAGSLRSAMADGGSGPSRTWVATGAWITPLAAPGSAIYELHTDLRSDDNADAANAVTSALSPDGKTLLILTSGYNTGFSKEDGTPIEHAVLDPTTGQPNGQTTGNAEWLFVYDVAGQTPVQKQKFNLPITYIGLVWDASGDKFYVSGGANDIVYPFKKVANVFRIDAPFIVLNTGGQLDNTPAGPQMNQFGLAPFATVAGLGLSSDGKTLYTANFENDSVSLVDTSARQVVSRVVFAAPGGKKAIGEYPFWIAVKSEKDGAGDRVFVSSQRDGQVVAFGAAEGVHAIQVGSEPNKMVLSKDGPTLYVVNGDSDSVSVIDTDKEEVVETIDLRRKGYPYKGANPNSAALSPDEKTLYVTLGGENAVAVIDLGQREVAGRIPTAWYPNSVSVSADGKRLFVVNAKSMPGPNPAGNGGAGANPTFRSEYIYALQKASLEVIPVPAGEKLKDLSEVVDANNGFGPKHEDETMAKLKNKIKHVIYIVKENRTYDQVLGDLGVGNSDPSIVMFPRPITPNHHKLAADFVTMDNFYCIGEVSGDGWSWSTQARANDYNAKSVPASYGNGFGTLDVWATDRNIVVGMADHPQNPTQFNARITTLLDPTGSSDILPGRKDIGSVDGDDELSADALGGYLWDEAAREGMTLRHYGFYTDYTYYSVPPPLYIPISRTPFKDNIPQGPVLRPSLKQFNDVYYRGFDLSVPDRYHYEEWKREFDGYVANGNLPALEIMSLPLDHFGSFGSNVGGLQTPELEIADNDYALGKLVEAVSKSPYWKDTVIFVVEDDAQDGPDHVDAHRSPGYVISAYTKRNTVVHKFYNTISMLRTMEDFLGMRHLGMNDANAEPMSDVFNTEADLTPYTPVIPGSLCQAPVSPDLIPECSDPSVLRTKATPTLHDGAWWAKETKQFNFRRPDGLDASAFNHLLWRGIKGENKPYPAHANAPRNDEEAAQPAIGKGRN
jgi:YVTN family beta-propeller protein